MTYKNYCLKLEKRKLRSTLTHLLYFILLTITRSHTISSAIPLVKESKVFTYEMLSPNTLKLLPS